MRAFLLGLALASILGVGVVDAAASVDMQPRVRMVDSAPLALRGVGFARHERVRLTVVLGEHTAVRKLRATGPGVFAATFPEMRYGRCGPSLSVAALGSRGHRVSWELVPLECPDRTNT